MPTPDVLSGQVVVITGGAGLLGSRFCTAVAKAGGTAVVADRDGVAAARVAAAINAEYPAFADEPRAVAETFDMTDTASVRALIARSVAHFGRVHAVVNNAFPRGSQYGRRMEDVTYEGFCETINLNLGGYFLVSQQFAAYFQTVGGGNIVNLGSVYGQGAPRFDIYDGTPMTKEVEYSVMKAGVLQLTRYFAQYLKGTGIRVNTLSPGGIFDNQPAAFLDAYRAYCSDTGMLAPEDVCGALVFLLSDAARYMLGQNLVVDDGFSL